MPVSTPLGVAVAATVLLVGLVGADLATDRSYTLSVMDDGEWRHIATSAPDQDFYAEPPRGSVEINRSDTVQFRLEAKNGYPWGLSTGFRVYAAEGLVHEGRIEVHGLGAAVVGFTVQGDDLLGPPVAAPPGERAKPVPYGSGHVEVRVGGTTLWADFPVVEVQP